MFKSILITGGTGTFGRAFARYAIEAGCQRVCILSRGEHAQAAMRQDFGATDQERLRWFIGDVRDRARLRRAMEDIDVVVHAAALKRIEVGEYNPIEMVRTNVDGAINVIEAATDAAVKRVVMLSTDKAYQPVSPYGQSKAMAEALFLAANHTRGKNGPIFSVTRYGNIAGSAGSVIPTWRVLLEHGREVPVTDPECTRFWMTLPEAVSMVADTIRNMAGGELIVPGWLPACRLGDLAQAMGADKMVVTGLPPHEKLHEGMLDGMTSDKARRMTVKEIREALVHV